MGLPETLLSLFAKLVEFRRSNPKKALILGFVLLLFLRKVYDRLTRDGTPIENKIVLITGGGMGIGRLVAEKCKKENGTVIVWDINDEALAELRSRKIVDSAMKVDVTNREQVLEAGRIVLNKYKHVDILINNAGIVSGKTITQLTERDVRKTFDVNIIAHFWTLQAFLPIMTKRQSGHIVTIASTAGRTGVSYLTDYCASKFACRGLDDALRHELQDLGHTNIKQTVINPYFINTGINFKCVILFLFCFVLHFVSVLLSDFSFFFCLFVNLFVSFPILFFYLFVF